MTIGGVRHATLRVRNDSDWEWPAPGSGDPEVRISYHWRRSTGDLYDWEGLRTELPSTLRPGETVEVVASVRAPWQPGRYRLDWDPLVEQVAWFSSHADQETSVEVEVMRAAEDPVCVDRLAEYLETSYRIPGWFRGEEAKRLALTSYGLPEGAVVVEIGSFLGSSTVLLAGARKLRGSGKVHCVDPFDCSGDDYSVPVYRGILVTVGGGSLRRRFEENVHRCGVDEWVEVHPRGAVEVAATWDTPIDLLLLDGDQSRRGARATYERWAPFLKRGGILAVHNSEERVFAPDHDGNRRLALEEVLPPRYEDVRLIGMTTFARKTGCP